MARLTDRVRVPEVMDQPGLDPAAHALALAGLRRINALCRSDAILWPPLCELARRLAPAPVRVLDIATGSGDVPIRLWRRFQQAGLQAEIVGCDMSSLAIGQARDGAARSGAVVQIVEGDVLAAPLAGEYDAVMCSLFLHHLDPPEVAIVLARMAAAARHLVLVNDLRRCTAGWWAAYIGTRLLSRSPVVHYDGPVSVTAAFTPDEAVAMAERAGLYGAMATTRWPWRFLLKWERSPV